ncbi:MULTISPECIES: helix-turn-helix domain-containing protein [Sphingobacteriaceae]|uniref:Transcriptional regulator, AraC family n=1 Tax=Sphingobacterium sp. (strain 21) TaxID=743722 RepID=F4CF74_SPHS2
MYIYSKLIESETVVCDIRLDNAYNQEELVTESQVNETSERADIQSKSRYSSGFLMLETYFSIRKKVTDQFIVEGEHIQLSFFLNGKSRMMEPLQDSSCDLDIGIMRRNYFKDYHRNFDMRGGNEVNYVAIYLSSDFFRKLVEKEHWAAKDSLVQRVLKRDESGSNDEICAISLPVLKILQELFRSTYDGLHQRYFIELKLKELLFLSYVEHTQLDTTYKGLENTLYSTLEKVKAYLTTHFDNPPTIKQLSRMFSLNELKLKQGFKNLYGTTIYAYVIHLRMQQAEKMLLEDYSVNEMSSILGYRSVSHFISTYKKHFGYTPKQALKRISQSLPLFVAFLNGCLDHSL